jgi:ABC-type sugar transport system ATPase subunit
VLFVSHSAQQVLQLCTKGIVLNDGKVVALGTAKDTTKEYMKLLHLDSNEDIYSEYPESRVGQLAGKIAELIFKNMHGGKLVFNVPVETQDGVRIVDVGWVSDSRIKTLRTQPTWSAAPDLCVNIVGIKRSVQQIEKDDHFLLRTGAQETWIVHPDLDIHRHRNMHDKHVFPLENIEI